MGSLKKKLTYSIGANIVSLLISVFTSIGIPKLMGIDVGGYGYFQIFVFYAGYIGFLHFGFCDGIILRVAGNKYEKLDKRLYSGEFRLLLLFETIIGLLMALAGFVFTNDPAYRFIWLMIGVNTVLVIPKFMLLDLLQVTARIKEYAIITMIGRVSFLLLIVSGIVLSFRNFEFMVLAQTVGEGIALLAAVRYCRDIVFVKPLPVKSCFRDMKLNVSAGYKLLVSNIAALLFAGIPRIFIQVGYDTTVYGKVSFAFVISNMVLTFISAIEVVLYPEFKQKEQEDLEKIYRNIDLKLMGLIFCGIALYYPFRVLVSLFLPQYTDSLEFMAYLLPLCAFSSKMNLLVQNDMKVYRMEKEIMRVNLVTVAISLLATVICFWFMDTLKWMMISVSGVYLIRCIYAELLLNKKISIFSLRSTICDVLISCVFIVCMGLNPGWLTTGVYVLCLVAYLFIRNCGRENEEKTKC